MWEETAFLYSCKTYQHHGTPVLTFPSHTVPKHMQSQTQPCVIHVHVTVLHVYLQERYTVSSQTHNPRLSLLGKLGSPWPGVCCAGQLIITANSNWSRTTDSMATRDRGRLQQYSGKSIVSLIACCHTESHTLDGRPLVVNTTCRSASFM